MPRIAGIDIPEKKKILFALQYIHGIGPKFAADLLKKAEIDPDRRANQLDDREISTIATLIDQTYVVEGALPGRSPPQGPPVSRTAHPQ
jgi:small subunit ribosomal protein S13